MQWFALLFHVKIEHHLSRTKIFLKTRAVTCRFVGRQPISDHDLSRAQLTGGKYRWITAREIYQLSALLSKCGLGTGVRLGKRCLQDPLGPTST